MPPRANSESQMHLKRMLPTLLMAAALSVAIAVFAAARHSELTFVLAAALFALQVLPRFNTWTCPQMQRSSSARCLPISSN